MKRKYLILFMFFFISFSIHAEIKKEKIVIAAASSLYDFMKEMSVYLNKVSPECEINLTAGGSGVLKSQILNGAPVDIFLFADTADALDLVSKNCADRKNITVICRNSMVMIIRKEQADEKIKNFYSAKDPSVKRIAIGNIKSVPAGRYAQALFIELGLYEDIKNKMIYADSVRQVLTYVEIGEADAGIVFKSDALKSGKVLIIDEKKEIKNMTIEYAAGITKIGENKKNIQKVFSLITGEYGRALLKKQGFITGE